MDSGLDTTKDLHVFNDKWSLITNKGYFLERMYYAKLLGIKFPETEPQEKDSINYNLFILNNGYKNLIKDLQGSSFVVDKGANKWDKDKWMFSHARQNQNALIEIASQSPNPNIQLKVLEDNKQHWENKKPVLTELNKHREPPDLPSSAPSSAPSSDLGFRSKLGEIRPTGEDRLSGTSSGATNLESLEEKVREAQAAMKETEKEVIKR